MNLNDITCCVIDNGLFLPLAVKLGKSFDRVLYQSPWERGFPLLNECLIGDGFANVERCDDFWHELDEIDLFVFPDLLRSGLQEHLRSIGKLVWGSGTGDSIELSREKFLRILKERGLEVPSYHSITGLENLRAYLKKHEDKFIKISKYRGSMETWHHATYRESEPKLDELSVRLGAAKNIVPFLVFDPIETELEVGYDGYCINGKFPGLAVLGYEAKDKGFICTLTDYDELPDQVLEINEAFGPELAKYNYRNFFSTEIRVKGNKNYFIDPCCRCPSPSTEAQIELYGNLAEIIVAGAQGECVTQVPTARFAVEAVMTMKGGSNNWRVLDIPSNLREFVKIGSSCEIDGRICVPPDGSDGSEVGWVVATGDSIEDAITNLKQHVKDLGDTPVTVHTEAISDLLKEVQTAEDKGIEFSDEPIPDPSIMLD